MGSRHDFKGDLGECVFLIRKGDHTAFKELFLCYYEKLCMFAIRYTRSSSVAEGLVQEVFVKIWENRQKLDDGRNIKSFLYMAVKNEALDYLKHQKMVEQKLSLFHIVNKDQNSSNDEVLDEDVFMIHVQNHIEKLPYKTRQIYKLNRQDGLTYNEIAMVIGISQKTVEYHITKAIEILRDSLKNNVSSFYR